MDLIRIIGCFIVLGLMGNSNEAYAKMCEATTTTGEKVYKFVGTPTTYASGKVATMKACPITADISFAKVELKDVVLNADAVRNIVIPRVTYEDKIVYVDKIEERITYKDVIKENIVYVDKVVDRVVYKDYEAPNPRNQCEQTAGLVCDPMYKGIKLYTNPRIDANGVIETDCKFGVIQSGTPPDSSGIYYAYVATYSGWKVDADGNTYCPQ